MKLQPYPVYKDSGVAWLGKVPEHWQMQRGKWLFRKMDRPVRDQDEVVTCFRDGTVTLRRNRRTRGFTESLKEIGYQGIRKGDLVIHAMDGFAGAIGVSDSDGKGSPVYAVCRPEDGVNSYFYAYLLREMARTQWIMALAKGIRERSTDFRFTTFAGQDFPFPPLSEQAYIVRFLNQVDRRIQRYILAKSKFIALLNEQKQAIIHQTVTLGLDPNVCLKPSGVPWLGDVPEHWEVLPLGRLLAQRKEKNNPIKTNNILSLGLATGVIPYADKKPGGNKAKEDISAYMLAYPGDIVLNSMNVVVGSVGLSKYFGAVSPVYYMLYPRNPDDSVDYFSAIFQDPVFQRNLFGLGNGIMYIESKTSGKLNTIRMRIPMSKLKRVLLPYPSPEEQFAINEHINQSTVTLDEAISKARLEVGLLQEYRKRLITDVVTGKVDIRNVVAKLPDEIDELEPVDENDTLIESEDSVFDSLEETLEEAAI